MGKQRGHFTEDGASGFQQELETWLKSEGRGTNYATRERLVAWCEAFAKVTVGLFAEAFHEEGRSVHASSIPRIEVEAMDYLREKIRWESQLR